MIYAKIYLEKTDKESFLVFESCPIGDDIHCRLAGKYTSTYGATTTRERTTISPASSVAISPEAREQLFSMLNDKNDKISILGFFGDFEFSKNNYTNQTTFGFKPDNIQPSKKLSVDQKFSICSKNGIDVSIINHMTLTDNEYLKNLNLSQPINENLLEKTEPNKQPNK